MASQIRSGVNGRSRTVTPVASATAEPIAAAMARMPPSPAPLRAEGSWAISVFDEDGLEPDGNILEGGYPVVEGAKVADAAAHVEKQVLHQRVTDPHHRGAFVLRFHLRGIEGFADVADEYEPFDADHPRLDVDAHLGGGAHHFPEGRTAAQRMARVKSVPLFADADQLASRWPEMRLQDLDVGDDLIREPEAAV